MKEKKGQIIVDGDILDIVVSAPAFEPAERTLTEEDVWGEYGRDEDGFTTRITDGMIVARRGDTCPVFGDVLEYKDNTHVCREDQLDEVCYWIEYVQGGGAIVEIKEIGDGKVGIRSQYTCW